MYFPEGLEDTPFKLLEQFFLAVHCESSTRKVADFCLKTRLVRVPLVKKFSLILAMTALRDLPNQKVSFVLPLRVSCKPLVDCSTAF